MTEREGGAGQRVAAIVVTYNRADVLRGTLIAIKEQECPPAAVLVVDNASQDRTAAVVAAEFPEVTYCRLDENLGFGAGLDAGIAHAQREDFDYFWLLDDDSRPAPAALRRSLEEARKIPRLGVLGLAGGELRWGGFGPPSRLPVGGGRLSDPPAARRCDFVMLDGALVPREAVEAQGRPRGDFFMMLEDVEYTTRMRRAGFEVGELDHGRSLIERAHLGSGGDGQRTMPWRGYYQTRNHLLIAVEHRSPVELLAWFGRQLKFIVAALAFHDRKAERIRLRMLGVWHALRGVRGKTIEPGP
jgi:GT2 family glycosyltransferase